MLKAIVYYREICYIDYILKRKLDSLLGTSQKGTLDSYVLIRDDGILDLGHPTKEHWALNLGRRVLQMD